MRIARAEFIKIFKKPSLYIMGIVLAIVILISSFFFNPETRSDTKVTLKGDTVAQVLLNFETDISTNTENKIQYDLKNSQAADMIAFYSNLNVREASIKEKYTALTNAFTTLNAAQTSVNYTAFKEAFVAFKNAVEFGKDGVLTTLAGYNGVFESYFDETAGSITGASFATIKANLKIIEDMYNSANCADTPAGITYFCNTYTNSHYDTSLQDVYDAAMNFITVSCKAVVQKVADEFNGYCTQVEVNFTEIPAFPVHIDGQTFNNQTEFFDFYMNKVKVAMTSLKNYLHRIMTMSQPIILVSDSEYTSILTELDRVIKILGTTDAAVLRGEGASIDDVFTPLALNQAKASLIKKSDFAEKISTMLTGATYARLSATQVAELSGIVNKTIERRDAKYDQLSKMGTNDSVTIANTYVSEYKHYNIISNNIVSNSIKLAITKGMSNKEVASLYGYDFSTFSRYSVNETLLKNQYLFDNETFAFDYSDVFSFNQNSASEGTTIFDFMFFALRISTLFIIVFAIIMAASLIASEFDSGTIKLLAIRPFKRGKIIMGKFFATMFFVMCFVLFSAIISMIAGLAMFDWNMQPVLAIFNSSVAFSISPLLLMLINIISIVLEIMFFTIIAVALSTITRSFAGTISTALVLYLLSLGLNALLGNQLWYAYSPFINTDLFKFMGGAFASSSTSILSSMFITPLLKNMNFYITLGMYAGISGVLLLTTYLVFKKRDI